MLFILMQVMHRCTCTPTTTTQDLHFGHKNVETLDFIVVVVDVVVFLTIFAIFDIGYVIHGDVGPYLVSMVRGDPELTPGIPNS